MFFLTRKPKTESQHKRFEFWVKWFNKMETYFYLFSIINTQIIYTISQIQHCVIMLFGGCFEHEKVKKAHWLHTKRRKNIRTLKGYTHILHVNVSTIDGGFPFGVSVVLGLFCYILCNETLLSLVNVIYRNWNRCKQNKKR